MHTVHFTLNSFYVDYHVISIKTQVVSNLNTSYENLIKQIIISHF